MGRGMIMAGFLLVGMFVSYTDRIAVEGGFVMVGFTIMGMLSWTVLPDAKAAAKIPHTK